MFFFLLLIIDMVRVFLLLVLLWSSNLNLSMVTTATSLFEEIFHFYLYFESQTKYSSPLFWVWLSRWICLLTRVQLSFFFSGTLDAWPFCSDRNQHISISTQRLTSSSASHTYAYKTSSHTKWWNNDGSGWRCYLSSPRLRYNYSLIRYDPTRSHLRSRYW